MKRLCKQLYVVELGQENVMAFMTGMVYDVKEFKDGEALIGNTWVPDYVFELCELKEIDNKGRD